jgi:hypothetical protein
MTWALSGSGNGDVMYTTLAGKPLVNSPICTDCNSSMRQVVGMVFAPGVPERVVYACTGCTKTQEHVV